MATNKVIVNGETLIDLTNDTVEAEAVDEGVSFHTASGESAVGTKVIDSELSTTSTNAVQNKVVTEALNGKANSSHKHSAGDITSGTLSTDRLPSIPSSKITSLDSSKLTGTIPDSLLPSYVDDVIEGYHYSSKFYSDSSHTSEITGESGKIYVDLSTNKTYRYSGSGYVVISETIALGETSSTAYRGDRGKVAYEHASAKGSAFSSGFYKITTNAQGHVISVTAVTKADITALGIPAQDTTYTLPNATASVLGGVKVGSNITVSSGTISLTKANVTNALGYTPPTTNTTYSLATESANGLMSASDKKTLNTLATKLEGTLSAGSTSITLSSSYITTDSWLDFYSSIQGVNPTAVSVETGKVTLTFEAQSTDMQVGVKIG